MSLFHSIQLAWPLWSLDREKMSPMGYDMVVVVKAYSLVKAPRMLPRHGNMMRFLIVLLPRNCGWNRWVINNDPSIPTTPSSSSLETWSHGKSRRKHHKGFFLRLFFVAQERYLQQILRYKRDESLNSADDSPQLLNALSSWWGFVMQIDEGVVS